MIEEKNQKKENGFLHRQSEIKNKIIQNFDNDKEIKYFNDCWKYLMEIISEGSTEKSDLLKYKFRKYTVYFMMYFVFFVFVIIIFLLVYLLPYLVSGFVYTGYWYILGFGLAFFLAFAVFIPLFLLWRTYVIYRQMYKFNEHQILLFENREYLLNFDIQILINLYKDSCFYEKFKKISRFMDWKIGRNKTCITCNLIKVFNYFVKVRNELVKGYSLLDACMKVIGY